MCMRGGNMVKIVAKKMYLFLIGAFMYSLIEIATRGYTHWTMFITGGICLMLLYDVENIMGNLPLGFKCVAGGALITLIEFTVGVIVNLKFQWNVWDYSEKPLNFMGQICFPFSLCWFFICFLAYAICYAVKKRFSEFSQ